MAGENEQIVRLFFDRQPEDKLSMTLGAGIREMYDQTDLHDGLGVVSRWSERD